MRLPHAEIKKNNCELYYNAGAEEQTVCFWNIDFHVHAKASYPCR